MDQGIVFCTRCGARLGPGSTFCTGCGARLAAEPAALRPEPARPPEEPPATHPPGTAPGTAAVPASPPPPPDTAPALALRFQRGSADGRIVPLAGRTTIGRGSENDLAFPADAAMSRRHAVIDCLPYGCFVQDAGSAHGTFVNGVRVDGAVPLRPGDHLKLSSEQAVVVALTRPQPPAGPPPSPAALSAQPAVPAPPAPPPPAPAASPAAPAAVPAGRRKSALIKGCLIGGVGLLLLALAGTGGWLLLRNRGPAVLASQEMSPANKPQRLEYQDRVAVTVPPDAFGPWRKGETRPGRWRDPVTVSIAAAEAPPTGSEKLKVLAAYDISAGSDVLVKKPLEIELAYDPKALPAGRKPEQALLAASWNPVMGSWVAAPCQVDARRGKVVIQARHLSVYAILAQYWDDVAWTDHFAICYDEDALSSDVYANSRAWQGKRAAEAGRDPLGDGRAPFTPDVPPFIDDVARMLEHAYRKYELAGFKMPWPKWTRLTVFVETSGQSQRSKLTGIITIACIKPNPADYRLMTAHELFHSVEAEYFSSLVPGYSGLGEMMAMNYRTWWLEACAEYAAWDVAWDRNASVARPLPKYLEESLSREYDQTDPQHMYQSAVFLQYLEDQKGADFRELWEDTVTRTKPYLGLERMSLVGYAAYELGLNWKPTEDWKRGVTLVALENHFLAKKQTLHDHYRGMAGWLLFDASSPLTGVVTGDDLRTRGVAKFEEFGPEDFLTLGILPVARDYAASVWAVRVVCDPPDSPRRLRVFMNNDPATGTAADIYVLPQNARPVGGLVPAGTLAANNATREVWLDLRHGDVIYSVATNTRPKYDDVLVSIDTGVSLTVSSRAIPNGLLNYQYRFDATAINIPRTCKSLEFEWDWGDGSVKASERRDPAPTFRADFQYMHAWNREQTYTLTVRLFDTSRGYRATLAELPVKIAIGEQLTLRIDPATMVAEPDDTVTFQALASKMPEGAQFEWTFGDGTAKVFTRDKSVSHRYAREGTFPVEVVLVDTRKSRAEGELAAAKAEAVIRKAGPVAIVVMNVQLHTGKSTSMHRRKGSDTTHIGFDFEQEWRFPKVQAQGLFFWGQGSEQIKLTDSMNATRTWRIKGQLTPDQRAIETLELEDAHESPLSGGDGRDLSRTRVVMRNIPLVRNQFGGMVCEVMGAAAAGHAPVIESTHTRESQYENYLFELDRNDIDWNALDRTRSLDKPVPAYVRVTITPTK